MAFSISSLTTLAGRSTTSPAAMRLMRFGGSWRMAIAFLRPFAAQIAARDELTRFYRGLVERIDAQKRAGENRLQHEVHHQSADGALVKPFDVDGADRPAGGDQRLGDGALLRRDEIAGGVPREIIGMGELARDPASRAGPCRRNARGSR